MINLPSNKHAFFAGRSQEGKTTLVRSFVNTFPRVVIHDRKMEWRSFAMRNGYKIVHQPDTLKMLIDKGIKRIIYQPKDPEMEDFNEVCRILFYVGNITLVIDEAASYCSTGRVPKWCGELLRLGSGRGIGVISLSQRPRYIDNVMLSESSLIVSFNLNLDTDRAKIAETCGKIVDPRLPEDPGEAIKIKSIANLMSYHFVAYDVSTKTVSWHRPIPVRTAEPMKVEEPKIEEPKVEEPIKNDEDPIPSS